MTGYILELLLLQEKFSLNQISESTLLNKHMVTDQEMELLENIMKLVHQEF